MMVFGLLMIPAIDNASFLAAFGFYHENYFMTMVLYTHLWIVTVNVPL